MFAPHSVWPPFLWASIILFLCLIPGSDLPEWDWFALFDLDKLVHAFLFFVQALLLARLFVAREKLQRWLVTTIAITILFGIATEIMQGLEALGRRTDINDMIANTVGAVFAGWLADRRHRNGRSIIPYTTDREKG